MTRKVRTFPGEEDKVPGGKEGVRRERRSFQSPTGQFKFVPDRLTASMREHLKGLPVDPSLLDKAVARLCAEGYKFTWRYDEYNSAYAMFLIHTSPEHINALMILAGRGSTPMKALRQLIFLHYEVWREEWSLSVGDDEYDD